jgi:pimeloyl-ACP methyl ester carboxylesterase
LEQLGHDALTVDLPCDDPAAGAREYAATAVEAFAAAPEDLVLVGHSLGGLSIPVVAGLRPVSKLVFLCAMLPRVGRTHDEAMAVEPDMVGQWRPADPSTYTDAAGASHWYPDAAAAFFFSDCDNATAAGAAARLRGQFWKITAEMTPLQRWPDVPSASVIGTNDPVINPVWSRRVSPEIVGGPLVELDCGHSPFLSMPEELARTLAGLA